MYCLSVCHVNLFQQISHDGTVCSWECSLDPEDLIERVNPYKGKIKNEKDKQQEEEDDIPEIKDDLQEDEEGEEGQVKEEEEEEEKDGEIS